MTKFKYFEVVLDDALDSAAAGEGFIDPREATDAAFSGTLPSTLALSRDKARANLRWKLIVDALKESGANDVIDIVVTGGTQDAPPTAITFKAVYESDKLVQAYDLITDTTGGTLFGPTGLGAGETEINVIERVIANALSEPVTKARFVYDPTLLGGKNTITKKFEDLTATNLATGATAVIRQTDLESPFSVASAVVAVEGTTGGYGITDTITVTGGTSSVAAILDIDEVIPTNGLDETAYGGTPPDGDFVAGANYTALDVITLNDGTTVLVDTVSSGAITEFTVDNSTTRVGQVTNAVTLTQASVSPTGGTGFTLTLDDLPQVPLSLSINTAGIYTVAVGVAPAAPAATTSSGMGANVTVALIFSGINVNVTQLDI